MHHLDFQCDSTPKIVGFGVISSRTLLEMEISQLAGEISAAIGMSADQVRSEIGKLFTICETESKIKELQALIVRSIPKAATPAKGTAPKNYITGKKLPRRRKR